VGDSEQWARAAVAVVVRGHARAAMVAAVRLAEAEAKRGTGAAEAARAARGVAPRAVGGSGEEAHNH